MIDDYSQTDCGWNIDRDCDPEGMLTRMKVEKGDYLYAIETAEGYLLTPYDPAIREELDAGQAFMKRYRDTFKALAE